MSEKQCPILIIGAGLAGLHLAWSLHLRQRPFTIISCDFGKPAWQASAGIINPVTGKRVVKSWRIDDLLHFAIERYKTVAKKMETESAYHATPLVRYFRGDPDEVSRFEERRTDPDYADYLQSPALSGNSGFEIAQSGWVDVQAFVEDSRRYFASLGCLEDALKQIDLSALEFGDDGISWNGKIWSHIVFCEGYHGQDNPFFDWLDYRISRGDVLDFEADFELPQKILNREKWVLPLGTTHGRTGSTYAWENMDAAPDVADAQPMLEAWTDHLPRLPEAKITQHRVGVRPGTNDSKPYAGPHPLDERICILNGFGSKGASQSPWCAEQLVEFLVSGQALPKEIDPARRLKFLKEPLREPQVISGK